MKDRFVGHVILRERGSYGQGLSHAERNGVVLSWRELMAATVPRVGLIRGFKQRKGSLQGDRNEWLRLGYRQTGPHPRRLGMTSGSHPLLRAAVCKEARVGGPGLVAVSGAISGRVGLRVLTGLDF